MLPPAPRTVQFGPTSPAGSRRLQPPITRRPRWFVVVFSRPFQLHSALPPSARFAAPGGGGRGETPAADGITFNLAASGSREILRAPTSLPSNWPAGRLGGQLAHLARAAQFRSKQTGPKLSEQQGFNYAKLACARQKVCAT